MVARALPFYRWYVARRTIRVTLFSLKSTITAAMNRSAAVRTKRWKYIRRYDTAEKWALPNCDDSISKTFMLEHGWADHPVESERLYDVVFDSSEAHNLAGNPDYADVLAEMRNRLERWRHRDRRPSERVPDYGAARDGCVERSDGCIAR